MRLTLTIVFSFIALLGAAQNSKNVISGKIFDPNSRIPVSFASIYISGTTIGCQSNEQGEFILAGFVTPCQLVVSHISYDIKVIQVNKTIEGVCINLESKSVNLSEVVIKSSSFRKNNIELFKDWFLGTDKWGVNAKIVNDEVLMFKKDSTGFYAETTAPLEIELPLLGYRLMVDLVQFKVSSDKPYQGLKLKTLAYYYFIPIEVISQREKDKIDKNRLQAYYCSPLHFCRSLYKNNLNENGYAIYKNLKYGDTSKPIPVTLNGEYLKTKSSTEYLKLTGLKDSCFNIIFFHDARGIPINLSNRKSFRQIVSPLCFDNNNCFIRNDGTIPDISIMFGGEMGHKRIGAMLPDNYYPNIDN